MKYIRESTENGDLMSIHFPSYSDFLECEIEEGPNSVRAKRYRKDDPGPGRSYPEWYGPHAKTSTDAFNNAILGSTDLAADVRSMWSDLDNVTGKRTVDYTQRIAVSKRRIKRGDFGDELDIHKVYQGQMDTAWRRTERIVQDETHSLVTLFVDYAGNCDVKARDTLWRTALTTRLVSELEAAGKSVKVVVGSASRGALRNKDYKYTTTSVVVKDYNQPLSIERLASMTHIGFFRAFGFTAKCMYPYAVTGNLGYHAEAEDHLPIQLQEEVDAGHTRFVQIRAVTRLDQAVRELERAYKQLDKFARGEA